MSETTRYKHKKTSSGLSAQRLGCFVIGVIFDFFISLFFKFGRKVTNFCLSILKSSGKSFGLTDFLCKFAPLNF
jgi:hypothetical protein